MVRGMYRGSESPGARTAPGGLRLFELLYVPWITRPSDILVMLCASVRAGSRRVALSKKSSADTFRVRSVSEARLAKRIGALSDGVRSEVNEALKISLDLWIKSTSQGRNPSSYLLFRGRQQDNMSSDITDSRKRLTDAQDNGENPGYAR